jgi:hypothetical protein
MTKASMNKSKRGNRPGMGGCRLFSTKAVYFDWKGSFSSKRKTQKI